MQISNEQKQVNDELDKTIPGAIPSDVVEGTRLDWNEKVNSPENHDQEKSGQVDPRDL